MSDHSSLIIDPTKLGNVDQALPHIPTLVSSPTNHPGILVFHYEQHPPHELPEYTTLHHVVPIWGMKSQAEIEANLTDCHPWRGLFGNGAAGIIPAGVNHSAVWDRSVDLTVIFLHPKFVQQITAELIRGDRLELIPKHITEDLALTQLGLLLKLELEQGNPLGRLYQESIETAFAARLLNHAVCRIQSPTNLDLPNQRLQILLSYIQDYLDQDIKLIDLANLVNLSEYYLCRVFKQQMGVTLHQYVIQQRVERAKQLLKHREMTITDIAQACGFSHHSHLTRHFKRMTGVSPSMARSS